MISIQSQQPTGSILVSDCSTTTCEAPQSLANRVLGFLEAALSATMGWTSSIVAVGKPTTVAKTLSFAYTKATLITSLASFSETTKHVFRLFQDWTPATIAASGWTSIGIPVNYDTVAASPIAFIRRSLGFLTIVKVPLTVYAIEFTDHDTVLARIRIEFKDDDCREASVFHFLQAANVSVNDPNMLTDPTSYVVRAPQTTGDVFLAADPGARNLKVKCFDSAGTQITAAVSVKAWRMPFSGAVAAAVGVISKRTSGVPSLVEGSEAINI